MILNFNQKQFRYEEWVFQLHQAPQFVVPIASDCSIPDYILDAAYAESNQLHLSHRAAASYRCYLLECLNGLNELFWAHQRGQGVQDVLQRQLENCFASGQCWRYTAPLIAAAVEDLPKCPPSTVGAEDAWDWVDATFNEGLQTGHIYDFLGYRQRAVSICKLLVETTWKEEGVALGSLYQSEGLSGSFPRIEALTVFEVANFLEQFGCPRAAAGVLSIGAKVDDSLIGQHDIKSLMSILRARGVEGAFSAVTESISSRARHSSGAISSAVFRTMGS